MKEKNTDVSKSAQRAKVIFTLIKFTILLGIIVGIPIYIFCFQRDILENFKSLEAVNHFLQHYKTQSVFVYIGGQILQILIAAIPGQALQFAAGYLYGFGMGFLYSLIGAFLGTIITFYLARLLGRDAMFLIFGKERLQKFIDKLNSKRAFILVFILYLIPGVPKDLFNYAAGVSEMGIKTFLFLSLLGRTPGMMGSLAIGIMLKNGSYIGIIVLGSIAVVLCVLGVIFHEKVTVWIDKVYDRLMKNN